MVVCTVMLHAEAIDLIRGGIPAYNSPQKWADFGCGSGTFTHALGSLLPVNSSIYAFDLTPQSIVSPANGRYKVQFHQANFEKDDLSLSSLDGIMMANALHYVKDKARFLRRMVSHLNPGAVFLVVEYDTMNANPWIPYPLDFPHLKQLFLSAGFDQIEKLATHPSRYGNGQIYACSGRANRQR